MTDWRPVQGLSLSFTKINPVAQKQIHCCQLRVLAVVYIHFYLSFYSDVVSRSGLFLSNSTDIETDSLAITLWKRIVNLIQMLMQSGT